MVWPVGDMDIDEVSVYATGFSGETADRASRPGDGREA